MNNPIAFPLQELFKRLTVLNGLLTHLESQYNNYAPLLKRELDRHSIDHSIMLAGSALAMRDLTQPTQNFRGYSPIGTFTSNNMDEYEKVLNDLLHRNSNWTVAQAYEAFDSFLKTTIAIYICENFDSVQPLIKNDLGNKRINERLAALLREGLSEKDFAYWKEFVAYAYRNSKNILAKVRQQFAKSLQSIEEDNQSMVDLPQWFELVTELRHTVTHSDGITIKLNTQCPPEMKNHFFPGTETELGFKFLLEISHARHNVELFAEYAYVIFKCLSIEQGYDINILEK